MKLLRTAIRHVIHPSNFAAKALVLAFLLSILSLGSMGYLDPLRAVLDGDALTFTVSDNYSISPWRILKVAFVVIAFFWISSIITGAFEGYLKKLRRIRSSNKALVFKLVQTGVYALFFLLTLDVLGIDLTALTVMGGAIGIGVGFGLQKVTSNFISGLILLFEKSIEEGDLIELDGGVFGFVRKTGGRFTLVETFEGKELMIPNEEFMTSRVTNWTFTNSQGRVEIHIGVSYSADFELARDLLLQAALRHPSCSKKPVPECYMINFGESSVDFVLYFWVDDVTKGRRPVQSDVMFEITKMFREKGIEIPFPQRDVHMK